MTGVGKTPARTLARADHDVVLVARRRTIGVATAIVIALAVLMTVLASGGATGADAERCALFSAQSRARERLVTGHGQRVVVIGDSYAVGLGLRQPETSWPSRLRGRTQVYGFSGSGFSAHTSPCPNVGYAARAPHAVRDGADLVVVEGGLNDHDRPAAAIRDGLRSLLTRLRGYDVLVVGPAPAPARAAGAVRVDALLAEECHRAGVRYLSMVDQHFSYLDDHLHLTAAGHRAFGDLVTRAVAR
jgi:acyl-CoA thioesterase-1